MASKKGGFSKAIVPTINHAKSRSTIMIVEYQNELPHDDVIKWKHFPRKWPFVRGIHRSPVNSTHKGQWRGALMFSFICTRINGLVNNGEAGDLRRHRVHYDVTVMSSMIPIIKNLIFMMGINTPQYTVFIMKRAPVFRNNFIHRYSCEGINPLLTKKPSIYLFGMVAVDALSHIGHASLSVPPVCI